MLTARAQEVLKQTPRKRVSLILTVRTNVEWRKPSSVEDRTKLLRKLVKFYSRKKQPLLRSFGNYESAGLRIIDALDGTPNALVSAPASVWRRVLREQPKLLKDPSFELQANETNVIAL